MTGTLATSGGNVIAMVAVLAIHLFAIVFGLLFVRARRAQRPTLEPSLASARSVLTIIVSFFRGPGCSWVLPSAEGVLFEL
ncbi:MAG TPA: hypothetical protein VGR41_04945 [Actinomycetota bacterium]|jgi:Na+/H+-dicarboxylate symporter|nr:hypothetical protein [Actinomycetota bacterium]